MKSKHFNRLSITYSDGPAEAIGYLGNIRTYKIKDIESSNEYSCLLMYFISEQGNWFKGCYVYNPYFYIRVVEEHSSDIVLYLHKKFESMLYMVDAIEKVDLSSPSHLSGRKQKYLKLSFKTIDDLVFVRGKLRFIVEKNIQKSKNELYGFIPVIHSTEPTN